MYLQQKCFNGHCLSELNHCKTMLRCSGRLYNHFKTKPRCSNQYVSVGFSRRKIPRSMAYRIADKAIRFQHPDYDPDRAQKLISLSMSRHLSTRNISSKPMHTFLSNLANRQIDRQTEQANAFSSPLSEVIK